jgi:hypothetical protein
MSSWEAEYMMPRHISVLASPIPPWGTPSVAGGDTPRHHLSLIHLFLNSGTHFYDEPNKEVS